MVDHVHILFVTFCLRDHVRPLSGSDHKGMPTLPRHLPKVRYIDPPLVPPLFPFLSTSPCWLAGSAFLISFWPLFNPCRYKRRLIDAAGRLSRPRASELNDLGAIAAKQHLETHRFATQARKSRTTIRLSPYSHELLMHFLRAKSRLLPIVNEHVSFEVRTRDWATADKT